MTSLMLPLASGGVSSVSPSTAARIPQGKTLVAYFSRSGNMRVIAGQVSRALRADLFEINPATPYPDDYFETVEQVKQESDRGYEPPLKVDVADIASYTTVFLGFPIWGMTAPPVIRSFLAAHTIATARAALRPWQITALDRIGSGIASRMRSAARSSTWRWSFQNYRRESSPCSSPTRESTLSRRLRSIDC